ncbi:unnamed protein product [Didymodactylos carnosus]|uniref:Uncharacterized protein n=1 Tax=Didymodactylos carnosus TaxID=1234261 RepID=A0A814VQK6_9BILA|nr:unnamed protein product [Didymodactylos carnosus]CAF1190490.1 unnamed protein product [Didymodactylos carnosus]CAF3723094.1 unnamed protein product [Didymodactylos carnosus]CAF3954705.1 unnamed protein product [Didymodactylos carnosus]
MFNVETLTSEVFAILYNEKMFIKCLISVALFVVLCESFVLSKKSQCPIKSFNGGKDFIVKGAKIFADKSFHPHLQTIGFIARACKVKVRVMNSWLPLRTPNGIIPPPEMPLVLGRAIRVNLDDRKGANICNNICMNRNTTSELPAEVKCFIDNINQNSTIFRELNMLHDGYGTNTPEAEELKAKIQILCTETK